MEAEKFSDLLKGTKLLSLLFQNSGNDHRKLPKIQEENIKRSSRDLSV